MKHTTSYNSSFLKINLVDCENALEKLKGQMKGSMLFSGAFYGYISSINSTSGEIIATHSEPLD